MVSESPVRTVVKIDLCGSKDHAYKANDREAKLRDTLDQLISLACEVFPHADAGRPFPASTYYRAEGDAVTLVLEKPTVALRSSLEFARRWWSRTPSLADCRIVAATGSLIKSTTHGEYTGDPFVDISKAEKIAGPGDILADSDTFGRSDRTTFQFIDPRDVEIDSHRVRRFARLNYDDPRTADDSALVHAVFVAEPSAPEARSRAYEVLAIELLLSRVERTASFDEFASYLTAKGCPSPDEASMRTILGEADFIAFDNADQLRLRPSADERLSTFRKAFDDSKRHAVDAIAEAVADGTGMHPAAVKDRVRIDVLVEKYVQAVFMEVRIMANYYRSAEQFFEILQSDPEYDYIIGRHVAPLDLDSAALLLLKRRFLIALRTLARARNNYIAAVFHNVLLLYYLNANTRYVQRQLTRVRSKTYYLDTNALYALLVPASAYHSFLNFAVERIRKLGAPVRVLEQSVEEYNESLYSALKRFTAAHSTTVENPQDRPWILDEFRTDPGRYGNRFEVCVRTYTVPPNTLRGGRTERPQLHEALSDSGLELAEHTPFATKEELGSLYDDVYRVKWKPESDLEALERKAVHDANCIARLSCDGESPYDTDVVFITTDRRLARLRRQRSSCSFVAIIEEFQEFITPFLLAADSVAGDSLTVPNLLLAAAVDLELSHTSDFRDLVETNLARLKRDAGQLEPLIAVKHREAFERAADQWDRAGSGDDDARKAAAAAASDLATGITEDALRGLSDSIARTDIANRDSRIQELEAKLAATTRELTVERKKRKGEERYLRAQRRRRSR